MWRVIMINYSQRFKAQMIICSRWNIVSQMPLLAFAGGHHVNWWEIPVQKTWALLWIHRILEPSSGKVHGWVDTQESLDVQHHHWVPDLRQSFHRTCPPGMHKVDHCISICIQRRCQGGKKSQNCSNWACFSFLDFLFKLWLFYLILSVVNEDLHMVDEKKLHLFSPTWFQLLNFCLSNKCSRALLFYLFLPTTKASLIIFASISCYPKITWIFFSFNL